MNTPNMTKRNTLILTLFILLLSSLIVYLFLNYQLKKSINSEFERMAGSTQRLFEINLKDEKVDLDIRLDELLMSEGLSRAISENDYKTIDAIVSPYYKKLKQSKKAVNILTFRSEDGITLYRAHKPEFFGDKMSEKRKLIADTNFFRHSFDGFEVGRFEMTYRITRPIFYNEKYVANVELGISPEYFLHEINSVFKTELGIAIDKKLLDVISREEIVEIDDEHVLIDNIQNLKKYFMDSNRSESLYKVSMNISLKNHLSENLGYLIVGFDIKEIADKNTKFIYMLFFMIAFMMIILVAVLHFGFNKILKYFSKQIYTDHLTNLKNRHALDDALSSANSKVLILSNIKEFSLLNELYGVSAGNETLIQVAHSFKEFAKEHGLEAYRISSDEYVLLKNEENFDNRSYLKLTQKLHAKIHSLKISIYGVDEIIGVEIYSGIAFDHAHSLEDAQMALKKAKKNSLSYMVYSKNVDTKESSHAILNIKKTIKYALEHKNVVPFFQPITDDKGTIVKYEALVRIVEFDNGKKNILPPSEFLEVSMNNGLYIKIAKEMLEQSLNFFATRSEKISVNFLPNDFFNPSIIDALMSGIEKFESPKRVVVEITEHEGVENFERLLEVVKRLRDIGILIAIDDFGSGYANYAHILQIKPDYLKIDGSLIKDILTNNNSKILVQSIVRFAKELGITTVAEYVETKEIFELLKEYGVDEFQGYYFGRPTDLMSA